MDFGDFKLKTPQGWTKFTEQGIDSYVGGLTNGKDSLTFDYGWYSASIDDEGAADHFYCQDTINGLIAVIQIPKVAGHGLTRVNIPHINSQDKFTLGGHNIEQTDTILKMFKSLVFKESDTKKNSVLTVKKFKELPFVGGGTLFKSNCASCHDPLKEATGPALKNVFLDRNNDWTYRFLTNRSSITIDSLYRRRLKQSDGNICNRFPGLTKQEVDQIIGYILAK